MSTPLWLPWTVVVALAVTAAFAYLEHARDRPHQRADGVVLCRIWAPTVVVLVVTGWLTVDRLWVKQSELAEAVQATAQHETGQAGQFATERFGAEIGDRLHHEVLVDQVDQDSSDADGSESDYQVRLRGSYGKPSGPTVCLTVVSIGDTDADDIGVLDFDYASGRCES